MGGKITLIVDVSIVDVSIVDDSIVDDSIVDDSTVMSDCFSFDTRDCTYFSLFSVSSYF